MRAARRIGSLLVLGALAATGVIPARAGAAAAESASLQMTRDPGDFIGQGKPWSHSTAGGASIAPRGDSPRIVRFAVRDGDTDWSLVFGAPPGAKLAVGTYVGAVRQPFDNAKKQPGLSVTGNGRGCNTLSGSFTVLAVEFAPTGELQRFRATFAQHCEGMAPSLRGELDFAAVPLEVGVTADSWVVVARRTGAATVEGTVLCNRPVAVRVDGVLHQRETRRSGGDARFSVTVPCTGAGPAAWEYTTTDSRFRRGNGQLTVTAHAHDHAYDVERVSTISTPTKLRHRPH